MKTGATTYETKSGSINSNMSEIFADILIYCMSLEVQHMHLLFKSMLVLQMHVCYC